MRLNYLVEEDFINYKLPSMFIGAPSCTMKCGAENCQNASLPTELEIQTIDDELLCKKFINNPITEAIVFGGLEPFDNFEEINYFISVLRHNFKCSNPIVIYTGYTEQEIKDGTLFNLLSSEQNKKLFKELINQGNITIKYGRYIANDEPHFDEVLGVKLASKNQYAVYYE